MRVAMVDPSGFTLPYDTQLCNGLGQTGHAVSLFTRNLRCGERSPIGAFEWVPWFYKCSDNVRRLPAPVRVAFKGIEHLQGMAALVAELRRRPADIVHFQWLPIPSVDTRFVRVIRALAPVVLTVHDTNLFHGSPTSRMQLFGWRAALDTFDAIIVHGEASKSKLLHAGISEQLIHVIEHGLLSEGPLTVDNASVDAGAPIRLLFFGAIKPYKGLDVLIKALAVALRRAELNVLLEIVGQPRMPVDPLKKLADELGIASRVRWDLRFVPSREIPQVFGKASATVLPYREIDQSGVLMMSIYYETPVIASEVGGVPELIQDGVHGFLVPPGDASNLATAIERVARDPKVLGKMREAIRELKRSVPSWNSIAQKTTEVYRLARQAWSDCSGRARY